MLRENKAMVTTVIVFVAMLILGAHALRSSREETISFAYGYEDASDLTSPGYPEEETVRQPIISAAFICYCQTSYQLMQPLAPLRPAYDPVQIKTLYTGTGSQLLLEPDGNLWSWGWNPWGHIGNGTNQHRDIPLKILDGVVSITPGGGSAIRADGSLWGWGQVRSDEFPYVQEVPTAPRHILDDVAAFFPGSVRDFVIRTDGSLWAWERSRIHYEGIFVPYENASPAHIMDCVLTVSVSHNITLAHRCNGSLWAITDDSTVHIMDEVKSFYQANHVGSRLRETLVIQTDNSLWAFDPVFRDRIPRHILDDVTEVCRTDDRAFIFQSNGALWAMGSNERGLLGDGTRQHRHDPVWIMDSVTYIHAPSGWAGITLAVLTDGSLWAWGEWFGEDGNQIIQLSPTHILDGVASVYQINDSNFALKTDGSLWAWGANWGGQLGDGTTVNRNTPVQILEGIATVYTSGTNILAIGTDGGLWTWRSIMPWYGWASRHNEPRHVPTRILDSVVSAKSDGVTVYAIKTDGSMWALGPANDGLLNSAGAWLQSRHVPVNISYAFSYTSSVFGVPPYLGLVPDIPFSYGHTYRPPFMVDTGSSFRFVDADARLWTWGWDGGWGGHLVETFDDDIDTPVHTLDSVVCMSTDGFITHALQANGDLWTWDYDRNHEPTRIMSQVTAFYKDWDSYFAIKEGRLLGWGQNWSGRLGVGNFEHHIYPVQILESVVALHLGNNAAFAHKQDGSIWSWGQNVLGVLGDNRDTSFLAVGVPPGHTLLPEQAGALQPAQIMDDVAIFHLQGHSAFAVQKNGNLWAWGDNTGGQLGDGTRNSRYTPVLIMDGVVSIHTTTAGTFVARADGSIWAWGWNSQGQLGDGTAISRLSPVRIMGDVKDMHLAPGISFAVRYDNSLWAWGSRFGHVPVRIMGSVRSVHTRHDDSFGHYIIDTGGGLWALDYYLSQPEFVMDSVAEVFSAWGEIFAVRENGELWTWGHGRRRDFISRDNAVGISFDR